MGQTGTVHKSDIGRVARFRITKSAALTFSSASVMVTPPGASTSTEWDVDIASQSDTAIVLTHTFVDGDLPAAGTYLWRAFFYDADGDEVDASGEYTFTVRAANVTRPEGA